MGPQQIKARLNQEPDISKTLTLLNQQGSKVIFGNLLVIPIKNSIVYIEPLYIQAEQSPMPQLRARGRRLRATASRWRRT